MCNKPRITTAVLKRKNKVQDLSVISRTCTKSSDQDNGPGIKTEKRQINGTKTKFTIRFTHTQLIFNKGTKTTPWRNKPIQKFW